MKLKIDNKEVEAEQLDFTPASEPFQIFTLDDGVKLKVRVKPKAVYKLMDKEFCNPDTGEPSYRLSYDLDIVIVPKKVH